MDGKLIYSKLTEGRFPDPEQVSQSIIYLLETIKHPIRSSDEIEHVLLCAFSKNKRKSV